MATLEEQLRAILPDVLPAKPEDALTGTRLIERVRDRLDRAYADNSIRQTFSNLSADPTSPIARRSNKVGYFHRTTTGPETSNAEEAGGVDASEEEDGNAPGETGAGRRALQPEEKFRAVFMRYAALENLFPIHIEHTRATPQAAGVNKWKFPDVVVAEWDVGEESENGYELDPDMLEVKRSLGEQPFRLRSIELKVELTTSSFRENFFQCVSNSKWAHGAQLAVAVDVSEDKLSQDLKRLGSSYDVAITSFGLSRAILDDLPSADEILEMDAAMFEGEIAENITETRIATGTERTELDWEHIKDLRKQSGQFDELFQWLSYCLHKKKAYPFERFKEIQLKEAELEEIR